MGFFLNFAVTVFGEFIVNSQTGSSVLHAPNQLSNSSPSAGFAVRRTAVRPVGIQRAAFGGAGDRPDVCVDPAAVGRIDRDRERPGRRRGGGGVTPGTAAGGMPTRTTEPLRNLDLNVVGGASCHESASQANKSPANRTFRLAALRFTSPGG